MKDGSVVIYIFHKKYNSYTNRPKMTQRTSMMNGLEILGIVL